MFGGLLIPSTSIISASLRIERGGQDHGYHIRMPTRAPRLYRTRTPSFFSSTNGSRSRCSGNGLNCTLCTRPQWHNGDRVAVLAAPPTTGKSTLTLALLERGLAYLSDELAPVDLPTRCVYPYARAVSLSLRHRIRCASRARL